MRLWYYTKMGLQQGPVPEAELLQKIRRAEIGDANLVWHEGMAQWLPVSQVVELKQTAPEAVVVTEAIMEEPAQPLPPSLPPIQPTAGNVPLPQPPAYHGNYVAPQIPNYMWQSVVALVISAGMMLVICLPIGMPFAIVALVYAGKVEGLRVQGRLIEAESASKSAKLWMMISYVISGLIIVGFIGVIIVAIASS